MLFAALFAVAAAVGVSAQSTATVDETMTAQYVFPPSRGASSLVADIAPCQGWVIGRRIEYPLTGGVISLASTKDSRGLTFKYSTNSNPTSNDDFTEILKVNYGFATQQCFDGPDFAAAGLTAGQNVTLQFTYGAGPGGYVAYQCADLTLVTNETFSALNYDTQCTNQWRSTRTMRDSAANPRLVELRAAAQAEADDAQAALAQAWQQRISGGSGLSATEGGLIGAFTTFGTMLIALGLAWYFGIAKFFSRRQTTKRETHLEPSDKSVNSA